MSTDTSTNRWFLRDWALLQVAFACIICALLVCLYWFDGWSPVWQRLHRPSPNHSSNVESDAAHYLASIIFVPLNGDKCWKRFFDNRTGAMWDLGYIKCKDAVPPLKENPEGMGAERLRAIGKALQHGQAENASPEQADSP